MLIDNFYLLGYNNHMKCIYIYNPESGNGKIVKHKKYIIEKLEQKYGKIIECPTRHSGHATEIARIEGADADYIFCSGGDGTLNEIINGIAELDNQPILGYIPTGTVNDVARSLGISKNVKKAVANLLEGKVFEHDIFKVNDRYGIYVCCAGLFTHSSYSTARSKKKRWGKLAYFFDSVKEVFGAKPVYVELKTDSEDIKRNCGLLLILNSISVAGIKLNKEATLSDGEVEVLLIHSHPDKVRFSEILTALNVFLRGVRKYKNSKKVTYRKLAHFRLITKEGTTINLDGEKSGAGAFDFSVINRAVKIISPKGTKDEKGN